MAGSLASLIPTPLHPAVVHLPMALAVLVPVFAVVAFIAVRRGARPMRSWTIALAMFGALAASGWASMETGENEEDRVESVVPRDAFHEHEEAAEQFVWLAAGVFGIAGVGLLSTGLGAAARGVATVGSLVLLVAGYRVGHTGGALVYTHGAASAYTNPAGGQADSDMTVRSTATIGATDSDDDGQNSGNSEDSEDSEDGENSENSENSENRENSENSENSENVKHQGMNTTPISRNSSTAIPPGTELRTQRAVPLTDAMPRRP